MTLGLVSNLNCEVPLLVLALHRNTHIPKIREVISKLVCEMVCEFVCVCVIGMCDAQRCCGSKKTKKLFLLSPVDLFLDWV